MLIITVREESFDSETKEFVYEERFTLQLEHSLVALSKWESIFGKPFLSKEEKSDEEILTYIHCMSVDPLLPKEAVQQLSRENLIEINDYMNMKATATWFTESPDDKKPSREVITSELIYYWMTAFHVPFEAEYWHLQRLFTLLKVAGIKNSPPKKMDKASARDQFRRLNAERRARMGSNG